MNQRHGELFLLMAVMGIAIGLHLLLPLQSIFEIFLIAPAILTLVWGVSVVHNQLHFYRIKQKWRETNLQRFKQEQPPDQDDYYV